MTLVIVALTLNSNQVIHCYENVRVHHWIDAYYDEFCLIDENHYQPTKGNQDRIDASFLYKSVLACVSEWEPVLM